MSEPAVNSDIKRQVVWTGRMMGRGAQPMGYRITVLYLNTNEQHLPRRNWVPRLERLTSNALGQEVWVPRNVPRDTDLWYFVETLCRNDPAVGPTLGTLVVENAAYVSPYGED